MRRAVALVSTRAARGLDDDMPPLLAAFGAAGADAEIVDWDEPAADWARFDAALLRSAWDYTERLGEFLAWIERVASLTMLLNPPPEAAAEAERALDEFLTRQSCAELVVKPAVGAGSRDTRRHARTAIPQMLAHMRRLLGAGRSVLLQPYLEGVDRHGETAVIHIGGGFSHAIRKGPLLPLGAAPTGALFAAEEITVREPGADELSVAQRVLAALPFGALLYARVDLIRDAGGAPCLLELELTEPSLYFGHAPGSAQRLVAATLARLT